MASHSVVRYWDSPGIESRSSLGGGSTSNSRRVPRLMVSLLLCFSSLLLLLSSLLSMEVFLGATDLDQGVFAFGYAEGKLAVNTTFLDAKSMCSAETCSSAMH